MTLIEFKNRYSRPCLADSPFAQDLCKQMVEEAFPTLAPFAKQIVDGFMSFYYDAAIAATYDGLCFSLETGWFEIGLDKCSNPQINPQNAEFFAVQTSGSHIYNVRIITNSAVQSEQTHIFADSQSGYKKLLIKGVDNFVQFLQQNPFNPEYAYVCDFIGMTLDFDDIEYLVDGFCGVNRELPLQVLGHLPSTIPNDDFYHYGNFSYNEKTNQCVSDTNGLPLRVNRALIDNAKENAQGWRVKIGSKPYVTAYSDLDCSQNFGFYQNKFCVGTQEQLDDWAANL